MFRRRCWLGALCLVLAAMLPSYVLGSQVFSNPSSLPVFETLSIPASPILYPSSPPILPFIPTQITDRMQKLTLWVDNTKQVVSRSFNKPRFIYSRLAMRAFRAIPAPLSRPSPPPSATRTLGGSLSPTRTRTTTTHHPAFPKPAYARLRGRSRTPHHPSKPSGPTPKSSMSQSWRGYIAFFVPGAARCLRVLYASVVCAARFPASQVEAFPLLNMAERVKFILKFILFIALFTFKPRMVHYRYNLIMEGCQFPSEPILEWKRPWTGVYLYSYFNRDLTERRMLNTMNHEFQAVRMKYAGVPGFSLKVRVTREWKVRDWYLTIFGIRSVEVPQHDCHGADMFETEDELMLAAPDLDWDLELSTQEWNGVTRGWVWSTTPLTPPQTPLAPQGIFVPPVRTIGPEDPEYEGWGEVVL